AAAAWSYPQRRDRRKTTAKRVVLALVAICLAGWPRLPGVRGVAAEEAPTEVSRTTRSACLGAGSELVQVRYSNEPCQRPAGRWEPPPGWLDLCSRGGYNHRGDSGDVADPLRTAMQGGYPCRRLAFSRCPPASCPSLWQPLPPPLPTLTRKSVPCRPAPS